MKKILLFLLLLLIACSPVKEKVFVANEESGSISVIDATTLKEIDRVSLTADHDGAMVDFSPHNIQSVGDLILITANSAHGDHDEGAHNHAEEAEHATHGSAHGVVVVEAHGDEEPSAEHPDQLVFMSAINHKILDRVDLDVGAHLAHVVSDGEYAYVTSTNKEALYKVELESKLASIIKLPNGSAPHGIRLSEDNSTAIIAGMGNSFIVFDLKTKSVKSLPLPGKGVQAGVAGDIWMVSVFDTGQLAVYEGENVSLIDLPKAKGPIQIFQSPDNRFVYVADQGVYFDKPIGHTVYKVDLKERKVVSVLESGDAPHGVVVSSDGRVWVTNLNGNSVSVFKDDKKVSEIEVGAAPNGITYWKQTH